MKQIGPGILQKSEIYFSSPSLKAKRLYYDHDVPTARKGIIDTYFDKIAELQM